LDLVIANMQQPAGARMQDFPSNRASDDVAAGDAAHAASQRAGKRRNGVQIAAIDKIPAAGEQELVGHGNADDPEYQQPEDGEIAIRGNPLEDGVFQAAMIT
jgi:hypothetical protein